MIRDSANRRGLVWSLAYGVPIALALVGWLRATLADGPAPPLRVARAASVAAGAGPAGGSGPTEATELVRFGDSHLRGAIELDKARLEGDRYVVALPREKKAILTLDPTLQQRAAALLEQANAPYGAIVVMSPDGRLLALAARSTAEPALGVERLALEAWAPAASVFKIVTTAALLDAGLEPETEVCYHGGVRSVEPSNLTDDPRLDRACANLTYGLARSQNAIIGKLAARHLDAAALRRAAESFGFGAAPAFALPAGISPFDVPEDRLELARMAAGFWHSSLSPLGGALVANTVATGGLAVTPRIVAAIVDGDEEVPVLAPAPRRAVDPDTAEMLAEMMARTVTAGTAYKAFHDERGRPYLGEIRVAGKTGSLSRHEPTPLNYSWFVGFAPADAPEVSFAVLIGNSPTWRFKAHTVARLVLETTFAR